MSNYKELLESVGLPSQQDLRITLSLLEKEWEQAPFISSQLTQQLYVVESILKYPLEYNYSIEEEPTLEVEQINPINYTPKRRVKYRAHKPKRKTKERASIKIEEPVLGPNIDGKFAQIPVISKPINDKGIMLYCNNLLQAETEIDTWNIAMDLAIGLHFNEWDIERKISYLEGTMAGNARAVWTAFQTTDEYSELIQEIKADPRKLNQVAASLKWMICGRLNTDETEEVVRKDAYKAMQNMKICQMSEFNSYCASFARAFWVYGDLYNKDLLNLFFMKLPHPWNDACHERYGKHEDATESLGTRIKFVRTMLTDYCLNRQLSNQAYYDQTSRLCDQFELPKVEFGCSPKRTKTLPRRKQRRRKFQFRKVRRNPQKRIGTNKPRFVRKTKRKPFKRKPSTGVKCFGCKQIGHYAIACPNKKASETAKAIEEEFGYICTEEIDFSDDSEYSYYELATSSSDSYSSENSSSDNE